MKLPFGLNITRDKRRDRRQFNIYASVLGISAAIPMYVIFLPGAISGNHVDIACVAGTILECGISIAVAIRELLRLQAIKNRRDQIIATRYHNLNPG